MLCARTSCLLRGQSSDGVSLSRLDFSLSRALFRGLAEAGSAVISVPAVCGEFVPALKRSARSPGPFRLVFLLRPRGGVVGSSSSLTYLRVRHGDTVFFLFHRYYHHHHLLLLLLFLLHRRIRLRQRMVRGVARCGLVQPVSSSRGKRERDRKRRGKEKKSSCK